MTSIFIGRPSASQCLLDCVEWEGYPPKTELRLHFTALTNLGSRETELQLPFRIAARAIAKARS